MENLRNVLEVDVGDIPTKPIDKEKEGFYLFVHGELQEEVVEVVRGIEKKVKKCKEKAEVKKYHFPLIKKDVAMFVFYELCEKGAECSNTKEFLPRTAFYKQVNTITSISMFLCSEGKISEVVYDPNYKVRKPDTTFSSFEYRYK